MSHDHRQIPPHSTPRIAMSTVLAVTLLVIAISTASGQEKPRSQRKSGAGASEVRQHAKHDSTITSGGDVAVTPLRMVATGIDFVGNTVELSPAAGAAVKTLADTIKGSRGNFLIEAHTDAAGTPPDLVGAQRLSDQRAAAVKAALIAEGVPAGRVFAMGMGARHPRPADPQKPAAAAGDSGSGKAAVAQQVAEAAVPGAKLLGMGWRALRAHRDANAADSVKAALAVNARVEVIRMH